MIDRKELIDAVHRWEREGILSSAQVEQIFAHEGVSLEPQLPPEPPTHTSLPELFEDICAFVRAYPGAKVLSADNQYLLRLGWSAFRDEGNGTEVSARFTIPLSKIKPVIVDLNSPVKEMMRSPKGRETLASLLERGINPLDAPQSSSTPP